MQYVAKPTALAESRMKHLARYIHTHPQVGWIFEQPDWVDEITIITDADWATDADTRRSVDCVHIFWGGHLSGDQHEHAALHSALHGRERVLWYHQRSRLWAAVAGLAHGDGLEDEGPRAHRLLSREGVVKRSGIQEVVRQGMVDVTTID